MSQGLPNELWSAVGDKLRDTFDWITIQTMSLVSPELRYIGQKLLCENLSITLVTNGGATTADRLDGLAKTPRLMSYVRSFRLALTEAPRENREAWLSKNGDVLIQVLKLLPLEQLEALCLEDWQDLYMGSPWESPKLKAVRTLLGETLQSLQEAPSISSLSTTHHAIEKFHTCGPRLKYLVVNGTPVQHAALLGLRNQTLAPTIVLESLESHRNTCEVSRDLGQSFFSFHQYLVHPGSPFSLRSLKRLVWNNEDPGFGDLRLVMESCTSSLQYLDLRIGPYSLNHDAVAGPTALIWAQDRLKHLVIQAHIYAGGPDPLLWLYHELSGRKASYLQLSFISIILHLAEPSEHDRFIWGSNQPAPPIGEALGNYILYPSLQSVQVSLSCEGWTMEGMIGARDMVIQKEQEIREAMSGLKSRGILTVRIAGQSWSG
ncbi:hypothetical protein BKA70DRAFT_1430127 [Coprinopsis sp. MPI-PUGE-AT-0042]|nr:hypothetical protein BKA70DRAFT_1430127 [Coprinopsis sp. MPI-PUGE-AT-0042]